MIHLGVNIFECSEKELNEREEEEGLLGNMRSVEAVVVVVFVVGFFFMCI